jgi:thiamine pyrophosphate-dependent acetolactate synthase large subunit-like protein
MGTTTVTQAGLRTGAGLLVESLEAQGVKHIFGIPGAKIDKVFDSLERADFAKMAAAMSGTPIHPLRLVHELQKLISEDVTLCSDMGSFHIWIARYLYSFRSRQVLITNGQQTLGVALPWAIAASLVRPNEKVISVSGDGGFPNPCRHKYDSEKSLEISHAHTAANCYVARSDFIRRIQSPKSSFIQATTSTPRWI